MDEERVLAADWLARMRAVASRFQRERLVPAVERLAQVLKRRMSPRQGRLRQEGEDEVWQGLLVDTQGESGMFREASKRTSGGRVGSRPVAIIDAENP